MSPSLPDSFDHPTRLESINEIVTRVTQHSRDRHRWGVRAWACLGTRISRRRSRRCAVGHSGRKGAKPSIGDCQGIWRCGGWRWRRPVRPRAVLPRIGGLLHAAGTVDTESLEGITPEKWDAGINVHLRSFALLVQALLPDLRANPSSAVVGIASINATLGNHINPIYSAAKGGMLSLIRSLADGLGRDNIRINAISPGQILTPMLMPAVDSLPAGTFERRILLSRLGQPEEIGRVARFLLSDEASYITAAEIVVDGGNISSQRM